MALLDLLGGLKGALLGKTGFKPEDDEESYKDYLPDGYKSFLPKAGEQTPAGGDDKIWSWDRAKHGLKFLFMDPEERQAVQDREQRERMAGENRAFQKEMETGRWAHERESDLFKAGQDDEAKQKEWDRIKNDPELYKAWQIKNILEPENTMQYKTGLLSLSRRGGGGAGGGGGGGGGQGAPTWRDQRRVDEQNKQIQGNETIKFAIQSVGTPLKTGVQDRIATLDDGIAEARFYAQTGNEQAAQIMNYLVEEKNRLMAGESQGPKAPQASPVSGPSIVNTEIGDYLGQKAGGLISFLSGMKKNYKINE